MQFLVLLDRFKREEGEDTLLLCVLIDHYILHPAVWRAAVVL
jgi:hypothetical protein